MAADLRVRPGFIVPGDELVERFSRSSGPGGQHVNTSDSRVELRFDVAGSPTLPPVLKERVRSRLGSRLTDEGVLAIVASEFRSQWRNREAARARLVTILNEALAPPPAPRRPTRPTRGAREARLADKRRRSEAKRRRRFQTDE